MSTTMEKQIKEMEEKGYDFHTNIGMDKLPLYQEAARSANLDCVFGYAFAKDGSELTNFYSIFVKKDADKSAFNDELYKRKSKSQKLFGF